MTRGIALLARRATQARSLVPVRGGGGGPLAPSQPPTRPLAEQDEMIWQDGTGNPEHALDQFTQVGKYEALGWLLGGLSVFGGLFAYARCSGVETRRPWADKEVLVPPQVSQTFAKSS